MSAIDQAIEMAMVEAKEHEREGRLREARAIYARVLVQIPSHRKAKKLLKAIDRRMGGTPTLEPWELQTLVELYEKQEVARALPMAQRLAKQHPEQPMLQNVLGSIYVQQGQADKAAAAFLQSLEAEPGFPDALTNLAQLYLAQQNWAGALDCLEQLKASTTLDAHGQFLLGMCLHQLGRMDEALPCYSESARTRPLFGPVHINLGSVLWALGRTSEALTSFENALELQPDDPEANGFMGNLLLELGREDDARLYLAKGAQ
ncbi:MAG: tetratricopeptide repeat protein [Pseudomonadota bacterium]